MLLPFVTAMHSKRLVSFLLFGLGVALLGGCPIYPEGRDHRICLQGGDCYSCPDDDYSSDCYTYSCDTTDDCPLGATCSSYHTCVGGTTPHPTGDAGPGSSCTRPSDCPSGSTCGADDRCHAGDCSASGCPSGYQCKLSGGTLSCVGSGPGDAGKNDAGFNGCHNDAECGTTGAKCLNGTCVSPQDQCFDTTQCPNNEQCVQGVCTPACGTGKPPCPTGFACDPKTNVCSGNASPCGATADSGTCGGGSVCVEDHCVAACGQGNACPSGQVCVAGGCIPDQKPIFTCGHEGTQDACSSGSICIHHSCYIACSADAGTDACKSADKFNQCKAVTTSTGTYSVCGSTGNLGTECDPTASKACTGSGVCIDGFCR